jgi:uncharacterized protein
MPTLLYFENALEGIEKSKMFYDTLFASPNKYIAQLKEGLGDQHLYWVVTAVDEKGNKALGGSGLQGYCGISMLRGLAVYVDVWPGAVPSLDQYIAKVEQLGGKIIKPKDNVPGMGYYAICMDTGNNTFVIWQTNIDVKGGTALCDQII